ncbi:NAD(P)-dependent oxidoreductase [uncultured Algimonas sp.]|uniref:NAD(P)-dependent oxidoreductase n=1 Tax=uncultured Algimonas sp. TaxID=1547920 RepID=UPI00261B74A6|nr:NAD(P)-dependent oxidoreductase [uncultured Algimonas sp.]
MNIAPPGSVVILGEDANDIAAHLSPALPTLDVRIGGPAPDAPYAVIGFAPGEAIADYGSADWIHISGAGANGMLGALSDTASTPPALITRTVGRMGRQIGEYVLSYLLADAQRHAVRRRLQRDHDWDVAAGTPDLIDGKTALILGTGGIGSGVALVIGALGVNCTGASRSGRARDPFAQVVAMDALPKRQEADLVVGALPLTPETQGRIDARVFDRLDSALFVNVGRGATADIDAVTAALAAGRLRHAVLDVVPTEPLPPGSPLWDHPGITITPHVSGLTLPDDTAAAFVAAYRALEDGRRPDLVVDPEAGY